MGTSSQHVGNNKNPTAPTLSQKNLTLGRMLPQLIGCNEFYCQHLCFAIFGLGSGMTYRWVLVFSQS
jgi:hypothetical protein